MPDEFDEFSVLPLQRAEAGIAHDVPPARRVEITLADGRTLSALQFGDAPPRVTFLHGAGLNAHTWDTTILALGLPALAIDLPGHGDSSWRDDMAYVARPLAADVIAGLDAWTERPQVLVGQSLGGLTAAAVAASRPDLVREVIVVDITPGIAPGEGPAALAAFFAGPSDWASRDELVDRAIEFGLGGGTREKVARGVAFNSRVREDGRVEWKHHFAHLARAAADDPEAAAAQRAAASVLGEAGWDDLAAVAAPITLLRGERGFVTEADADAFAARLPEATVLTVPAGHNVQEEIPLELADRIARMAAV